MTGPLLALLSAFFFALHAVFVRRAVLEVEDSSIGILISVPLSLPILVPILLLFFSFLLNRKIEIFNRVVVFGTITVVAGSLLLI